MRGTRVTNRKCAILSADAEGSARHSREVDVVEGFLNTVRKTIREAERDRRSFCRFCLLSKEVSRLGLEPGPSP
jgi:hypothetical protein